MSLSDPDLDRRIDDLEQALARAPDDFAATWELASLLLRRGSLTEAEAQGRNAVRLDPLSVQAHQLLGMILTEAHLARTGEFHYRRALALSDHRDPILLANLAWNLVGQGRLAEARGFYDEALEAGPPVFQTLLGYAQLEEADSDFEAAERLLSQGEALAPGDRRAKRARAVLQSRTGRPDEALATLRSLAQGGGALGPGEMLEEGRLLDRLGRHDAAFQAFVAAKAAMRAESGIDYMAEDALQEAARLKSFFIKERLDILPRAGRAGGAQPVFIVGFPRSGTTLIEQMVSAHSRVTAGGELTYLVDLAETAPRQLESPLGFPEALSELWMGDHCDDLDDLRDHYLRRAARDGLTGPEAAWFTDKMPLNETYLGLIALLFPASPIVHVVRHPLDSVLSAFSHQLTHGSFCAYSLEGAAAHYALVADLVEHYRAEVPMTYLRVRYEDVVEDPEPSLRRIMDSLDLALEPACLDPQANRRRPSTPSYAQVDRPLYCSSRYRYRHYLEQLAPIVPILAEAFGRLGYEIEPPAGAQ